jgi:23S rRNA pseudouridine2605 synthase
MLTRIQKIIADRGYCSRRRAEELIQKGLVSADGQKITELGTKLEEDTTVITIGNTVLRPADRPAEHTYLLINKPLGFITTMADDRGRKTVDLLVPTKYGRLFPVGRLDINSSGALIMTDDGEFANLVMHPSSQFPKTYEVTIDREFTSAEQMKLEKGIMLEDGLTAPAQVRRIRNGMEESVFEITIHEGKNREVRRMVEALGHVTLALTRTQLGPLSIADLPSGSFAEIPPETIKAIKNQCLFNKAHNTYQKPM